MTSIPTAGIEQGQQEVWAPSLQWGIFLSVIYNLGVFLAQGLTSTFPRFSVTLWKGPEEGVLTGPWLLHISMLYGILVGLERFGQQ